MRFLKKFWPTIIVLLVVLYATEWPDPLPEDAPPLFFGADKLIHAIMMGGIVAAVLFDLSRHKGRAILTSKNIWMTTLAVAVFAAIDEISQSIFGLGRESDILDLLADWGGCIIAALTAPPVLRYIFRKKNSPSDSNK